MTQRAPRAAPQPGRGSACWASQSRLLDAGVFSMPIGQSVPMIDARERVTGAVGYALNVELPGMLTGRILRSTHPHARVVRVDTTRAERLPGVVAVLSRNDLLDQTEIVPYF